MKVKSISPDLGMEDGMEKPEKKCEHKGIPNSIWEQNVMYNMAIDDCDNWMEWVMEPVVKVDYHLSMHTELEVKAIQQTLERYHGKEVNCG